MLDFLEAVDWSVLCVVVMSWDKAVLQKRTKDFHCICNGIRKQDCEANTGKYCVLPE
jgi:hypothetical protein